MATMEMDGNHTAMCCFMCHKVWTCVLWHIDRLHFCSHSIRAIVFHIRRDHTFNWRPLTVQCATKIGFLPILKCGITLIRRWESFCNHVSPLASECVHCSLSIRIKLIWILDDIIVMRSNDCQNQYPLFITESDRLLRFVCNDIPLSLAFFFLDSQHIHEAD